MPGNLVQVNPPLTHLRNEPILTKSSKHISNDSHDNHSISTAIPPSNHACHTKTQSQKSTAPAHKLRIAVVGSGLAGLTAAHLLSSLHLDEGRGDQGIEVELFEKAHKLGMDAASLSVTCPCQKCALAAGRGNGDPNHEHVEGRMDVPMRSFFPEYYPNLVRLYRSIGVKFHDADNTLACFDVTFDPQSSLESPSAASRLKRNVNVETPYLSSRSYKVSSDHTITLPDLPPLSILNPYPFGRRLLGYYRIARDYVKMLAASKEFMTQGRMMEIGKDPSEWGNGRQVSLREFLVKGGYSHDFSAFFVPLFACVCTCSFERMMEYPACVVLEYVARCMPFGRMQFVSSGVREVTENLSKNINTIHYNTMVEKIIEVEPTTTADGKQSGSIILIDSFGVRRTFDHVIFATQANQAAATLAGQRASKPLPKPFVTSHENDYDDSNYGRKEEHDLTDPVTPKDVSVDSIATDHPFHNQIQVLSKFPYERTQVVCHTDTSFLPKDPAAWRLLNIAKSTTADILASPFDEVSAELEQQQLEQEQEEESSSTGFSFRNNNNLMSRKQSSASSSSSSSRQQSGSSTPTSTASQSHNSAMATHIMNNTASSLGSTTKFLQTTNPIFQPKPESVISSAWFERAVVNPESMKAVDELNDQMDKQATRILDGSAKISDRVWFVGSYAYPGIPLLEGCVVSAVQVMERIVGAEPAYRLATSVSASEGSFLKRDAPMRERRQTRMEEQKRAKAMAQMGDKDEYGVESPSASSIYFKTAWKDTLEDEQIWEEQERARQATIGSDIKSQKKGHFSSAVGSRSSNVYVEVAWMLLLYVAAIAQWWMVFMLESVGVDGSRWALA
ncbi:hypothetical protein BGZ51_002881 [Haplosporangium sp. Z 767]|nr:hypothetical protein BGZ50_002557 [Haplosporangium sp. Z 11]KAF9193593.1 hypothetical protein BGZ51_002881 [Haplosporangium sp. Z 767]